MVRGAIGLAVFVLGIIPGVAHAGEATCSGVAPAVSSCRTTFVASGGEVGSVSQLIFEGRVDLVASASSGGRIEIHCVSSLTGGESCTHSGRGSFVIGETVTVVATAAGVGYWRVSASA